MPMFAFDRSGKLYTEGCVVENDSDNTMLILVNPSKEKEQIQYYHSGKWWYVEMLPNTAGTVVFEA